MSTCMVNELLAPTRSSGIQQKSEAGDEEALSDSAHWASTKVRPGQLGESTTSAILGAQRTDLPDERGFAEGDVNIRVKGVGAQGAAGRYLCEGKQAYLPHFPVEHHRMVY